MNEFVDRKLIAECIVLLSVCVGAWLMAVRPKLTRLQELEVSIAEAQSDPARESRQSVEQIAAKLDDVRAQVREIEGQNALGRDSSQMYGLIMDLAKAHDVTVGRLDPGSNARSGAASDAVEVTAFSMSVGGKYRQVAAFLEGIADIDGFVRPGSLSLTPEGYAGDNALVSAQFACETLNFAVPEALASIVGDDDADE